jgi:hypothetical protein
MSSSSSSLKEAARAGNGNRLIHDPFTDSQVLGDPAGNLLVLAGDLVRLETVSKRFVSERCFPIGGVISKRRRERRDSRQTGRSLHSSEESRDYGIS